MALIAMAVYDTIENERSKLTKRVIDNIVNTVCLSKYVWNNIAHRLIVVNNNSCEETTEYLDSLLYLGVNINVIHLPENVGTAKAINQAWKLRNAGEHAIKMDNDAFIEDHDKISWVSKMESVLNIDPTIGIVGLKRMDIDESPDWPEDHWYHSKLRMLPHEKGKPWIIVEEVNHVIGTCQMYSSALLDKIGYLYQMNGLYGFDDALASLRAQTAGFKTVFLPHIKIHHLETGNQKYIEWKHWYAGKMMDEYHKAKKEIILTGKIYHDPD